VLAFTFTAIWQKINCFTRSFSGKFYIWKLELTILIVINYPPIKIKGILLPMKHNFNLFYEDEHLSSTPVFSGVRVSQYLVLYVCFVDRCLSFCPFLFWPLCCLFFFDIRILISPLVSSNSSQNTLVRTCRTSRMLSWRYMSSWW
jgi:hypothetical protein